MITIPKVKLLSGREIPKLGLGTWGIGGFAQKDLNNDDRGQIESVKFAIYSGFTFIRTAHNYAQGYCEELVGQAIKGYTREKLFLVSAANQNFAVDKKSIIEIARGSLKSLQTDYFDLYLIGAVNPDAPIKDILDGLVELQESGLAKDIGVSNYRLPELKAAVDYLGKKIVYDEFHYNLIIREAEVSGTLDFCRENSVVLSTYRPLQLGQLSRPGILLLDEMAKKYGKSQSQIALKWLVQKDGVITMTKATNKKHILEDLDIFGWQLEKGDEKRLDKDFPIQILKSDCVEPRKFKF